MTESGGPSNARRRRVPMAGLVGWLIALGLAGAWWTGRLPPRTPAAKAESGPAPVAAAASRELDRLREEVRRLKSHENASRNAEALAAARREVERLRGELASSRASAAGAAEEVVGEEVRALRKRSDLLQNRLKEANGTVARQDAQLAESRAVVERLRKERDDAVASRASALASARVQEERGKAAVLAADHELRAARATLARATEERDRLRAELAAAASRPDPGALVSDAVRRDVGDALRRAAVTPGSIGDAVRAVVLPRVGSAPRLLPSVRPHLADAALRPFAASLVGHLRDLEPATIVAVVEGAGLEDAASLDALAIALDARLGEGERAPWHDQLLGGGPSARSLALRLMERRPFSSGDRLVALLAEGDLPTIDAVVALRVLLHSAQWGHVRALLDRDALPSGTRAALLARADVLMEQDLPRLVPHLLAEADGFPRDLSARRRAALLLALHEFEREEALPRLARLLGTAPEPVAVEAALLGEEGVPAVLAERARGGDASLPANGVLVDGATVTRMLATQEVSHVPFVEASWTALSAPDRPRALAWLWRWRRPVVLDGLRALAGDADPAARRAALGALPAEESLRDVAVAALSDGDRDVARAAVAAVERVGGRAPFESLRPLVADATEEEAASLIRLARGTGEDGALRTFALELFGQDGPLPGASALASFALEGAARDVLWPAVAHARPAVRSAAVRALLADPEAVDGAVLERLEGSAGDLDPGVRAALAEGLAGARHDLARLSLLRLTRDGDAAVRAAAARSLGEQEPYHVVPILRRLLKDADPRVVTAARLSLAAHGVLDERRALVAALRDPESRERALRVLRRALKQPDAESEVLVRILESEEESR